jgi:uncharacterized protein YjbI with pentapeptide repeats
MGLRFDECSHFLFSFSASNCTLDFSSFYKLNLKKTIFKDCKLLETDFTETNLTNAAFLNCDLSRAVFQNSILEGADLRSSYNFSIHPEHNRISKAKFSYANIAGLLHSYNISLE